MRATYDLIVSLLTSMLITMMGVKEMVVKKLDVEGFVNTILFACNLERYDASMKGYSLSEYKVDARLAPLVMPRGVYVSSDRLAMNLLLRCKPEELVDLRVLSPSQFMQVQAEIIGAMRKSPEFNATLFDCLQEVELGSVAERVSFDGGCHWVDVPFLPLTLGQALYSSIWYNTSVEDELREFITTVLIRFR